MQVMLIDFVGALICLGVAWFAWTGARRAWRRSHLPADAAMQVAAAVWAAYLVVSLPLSWLAQSQPVLLAAASGVASIFYQLLIASVAFLLLTMAGVTRAWPYYLTLAQAFSGLVMVLLPSNIAGTPLMSDPMWVTLHLLVALTLAVVVARQVYFSQTQRSWLALASCGLGLGLWTERLLMPQNSPHFLLPQFFFFAFFLWVMWHVVSMASDTEKLFDGSLQNFRHSTGFAPITTGRSTDELVALAVGIERRRIALELHDGIGSQLVNVLSTLTASTSHQARQTAMALEQCLSDLKLTVDAMDGFEDNVPEALGQLRYRMQRALDGQGIQIAWKVQVSAEIEAIKGAQSRQVLRIAQESVANVMRHAQATALEVTCRYVPEFCHLLLEVRDNGRGITRDTRTGKSSHLPGKGIEGMRKRAAAMGGHLLISSKTGVGTTVRLTLPLTARETADRPRQLHRV